MKGDFSMSEKPQKSYEQAVDQFIRENRYKGQVLYDDLSNQLVVPYSLDADAMDQLIQKNQEKKYIDVMKELENKYEVKRA